jgi:hypothetical protein
MSTEVQRPWVPTELPEPTKKQSLVDQICEVFQRLWADDEENTRALATSTDRDDAVEGSVTIDKILLAALVRRMAPEGSDLAKAAVGDITRVMHHATKRFGVDRVAIAAKKAEWLAIQAAESVGEQDEPGLNSRRESPIDGPAES